jgi:hypothetical protein
MAILRSVPHFDAERFDQLIAEHGTPARLRKARSCPCWDVTGHPRRLCPHCDGLGIAWAEPQEARVLMPGRDRRDQYDWMGYQLQGITHMTMQAPFTPAHYDLVELTAAELVITRERHVWNGNPVRLRMPSVKLVESVLYIAGADLVEADATLAGNTVALGAAVPSGTQITVRYVAMPAYVILSPIERDEAGVKMPYRALVQRLDFFSERQAEVARGDV